MPVLGGGPGDVNKMLQDCLGHLVTDIATDEVELVVVDHYEGRRFVIGCFGDSSFGETAVNRSVSVLPGIVDLGIDVGGVG